MEKSVTGCNVHSGFGISTLWLRASVRISFGCLLARILEFVDFWMTRMGDSYAVPFLRALTASF